MDNKEKVITSFDEKVSYLARYCSLLKRIELMNDELYELEERRNSLQSISVIEINKDKNVSKDRMIQSQMRIDKAYRSLMEKIDVATEISEEIYVIIDSYIGNESHKNILFCRYIKGMTFEEIGDKLGFSCTHVQRLHKKIINNLVINKKI